MTSTVETEVVYGKYSKNLLFSKLESYYIPNDLGTPMALYLTRGYMPGGCLTALLANDAWNFIGSCHPGNSVEDLKNLTKWILNCDSSKSWSGSYEKVREWNKLTDIQRNAILVDQMLVYTAEDETWKTLRDDPLVPLTVVHMYGNHRYSLDQPL